ncbi:MAG: MFS transporter [Anaerolineaceae bacterium]|nr:MFS transporter [Anaerolineaceae bacterium]
MGMSRPIKDMSMPDKKTRVPLYALYITSLISVTGDAMAAIAIPWFVLETTGSTVQTGIVAFFSVAPIVIGMFFGGTIVDRTGYKPVSVFADLASGLTILLIPVLYATVGLEFWQLLVLIFLGNLMDAPGRSARQSLLPEVAEAAGMSLERAAGLNESLQRATTMIGAPIAGLLIAALGATGVLAIDAITFIISALGMLIFIPSHLANKNRPNTGSSYWADLKEGYRFMRTDRLLLSLMLIIMVTNMIDYSLGAVTLPVYMRTLFGPDSGATTLGLVSGAFGAASLLSGLLYSWLGDRFPNQLRLVAICFVLLSARFFLYAFFPPVIGLVAISVLAGIFAGPLNPVLSTIEYRRIPPAMRGRVQGMMSAGVLVAMPIGGVLGGFMLEWVDMQTALVLYGAAYIVSTSLLFFNRDDATYTAPSVERATGD